MDYPASACPKCNRSLQCSGVMVVHLQNEDREVPVYQCDECLMMRKFDDMELEISLTFAVGSDGQRFDPGEPDGVLRF